MPFCRGNICASVGPSSNSKDETVEAALSASRNQEVLDGYEKSRFKNDSIPSTSKQGIESNNWKNQVKKKHQTCSGPLIPSNVHSNSFSERGHTSDRFLSHFLCFSIFMIITFSSW